MKRKAKHEMGENRDKLEPLSVSHCLCIVDVGALQKELCASPVSLHAPGPGMGETEEDMAGPEDASTWYCPLPTQ